MPNGHRHAPTAISSTRWAPDPAERRRILVDNPARLYGFDPALGLAETAMVRRISCSL
jgi:hypothetical protein